MNTLVIPKELIRKGDLVLVPREEYESLLRASVKTIRSKTEAKNVLEIAKALPMARRLKRHKAFYEELDKSLAESLQEYKDGKYYGPFETAEEFTKFLHPRRIATKK
ncbi:MAG: hypothetical protein HYT94_00115 [Parcubacteria group bacterium]|nr:hypothetical protein [Parcubacteria group bacterium]